MNFGFNNFVVVYFWKRVNNFRTKFKIFNILNTSFINNILYLKKYFNNKSSKARTILYFFYNFNKIIIVFLSRKRDQFIRLTWTQQANAQIVSLFSTQPVPSQSFSVPGISVFFWLASLLCCYLFSVLIKGYKSRFPSEKE